MVKNTLKHFVKNCTNICCRTDQKYDLVSEQCKSSGRRNCRNTKTWERKEGRKLWWPLIFQKVPELETCEQRCLSSCQLVGHRNWRRSQNTALNTLLIRHPGRNQIHLFSSWEREGICWEYHIGRYLRIPKVTLINKEEII